MFNINLIKVGFTLITLPIIILGSTEYYFEKFLPTSIKKSLRYGKFAYQDPKCTFKIIEVPKSWFKHFYIFSSAYSTLSLIVCVNIYIFGGSVPQGFQQLLDLTVGTNRTTTVNVTSTLIALILLTLQCYRRLYETHVVSVFAETSRINIFHYIIGYAHYAGAIGAILAEAPIFANYEGSSVFRISDITMYEAIGIVIFMWAWIHQFRIAVILASLRKTNAGAVVSYEHKLPNGDWFYFVSSPHMLAEILMYIALTMILRENSTWYYALAWVTFNQIETSILNHKWYKETFKNYPVKRKIVVPYLF